jgi:very-short-patch-repair endonuclease
MFICPRCSREFDSYVGLARHTTKKYGLNGEQLYREYHGISEIVICKCGCGTPTRWSISRGYRDYITGHNSKGENNVMFGKKHSEEARKSISSKRKEKFANGEYTFITTEKWSDAQKRQWATPGYKERMKRARENSGWHEKLSKAKLGKNNPWYGKKRPEHSALMKTPEMMEKIFAKRSMTDIEQRMASMLDMLQIEYHSQFFISSDGDTFAYDFKLVNCPLLIEVDGDYWHGGPGVETHVPFLSEVADKDNLKTQIANERGYTVLRFWGSDILNNPQQVITELLTEINKTSP